MICKSCRHWTFHHEEERAMKVSPIDGGPSQVGETVKLRFGVCRRFPPTPLLIPVPQSKLVGGNPAVSIQYLWPTLNAEHGCGEWRLKDGGTS